MKNVYFIEMVITVDQMLNDAENSTQTSWRDFNRLHIHNKGCISPGHYEQCTIKILELYRSNIIMIDSTYGPTNMVFN